MTLDQEDTEEPIGNSLKDQAHESDLLPDTFQFFGHCKSTSGGLSKGR